MPQGLAIDRKGVPMNRYTLVFLALALVLVTTMLWQHVRYADLRRSAVQDRQPLIHGDVFHALTFLKSPQGVDPVDAVRSFKAATDELGGAHWIYAGKVITNAQPSAQMGPVDWTATILVQYPSKQAFETAAAREAYRQALGAFEAHYSHGAKRSTAVNLLLPHYLLMLQLRAILTFADPALPFTASKPENLPEPLKALQATLRAAAGETAVVVVNLQKFGTAEQQRADNAYANAMLTLMAQGGFGPMHVARPETPPGSHDFDNMALVYYPGPEFFADMIGSTFYRSIFSDKQLGDNQSTITVPIMNRL